MEASRTRVRKRIRERTSTGFAAEESRGRERIEPNALAGENGVSGRVRTRRRSRRPSALGERAAVSLQLLVAVALVVVLVEGLTHLGTAALGRARLDAAADLVALAEVTGGPEGGRAVAAANGVIVLAVERRGVGPAVEVQVEVSDGARRARAAARAAVKP